MRRMEKKTVRIIKLFSPENIRSGIMKVLIAIVMFLFGIFVGLLIMPTFQEFSSSMYIEEEYSMPKLKTILREFGITLPPEATEINLFSKQDGQKKQLWVKFECSPEVRDELITALNSKFSGMFNREIESPKMLNGTVIPWWSYRNTFLYYEFHGMCAAYDDILRTFYIYAVSEGDADDLPRMPPSPSLNEGFDESWE